MLVNPNMQMGMQPMMVNTGTHQTTQQHVAPTNTATSPTNAVKPEDKKNETAKVETKDTSQTSGDAPVKGHVIITIHEAKDMADTEKFGKQDPFVKLRLTGNKDWKSKTQSSAGTKATWEETCRFVVGDSTQNSILVYMINENTLKNTPIGDAALSVLEIAKTQPKKKWIPIANKGAVSGQLCISVVFEPAVVIHVHECKDLFKAQALGKMDPYVKIKIGAFAPKQKGHTIVCRNGHITPKWKDEKHSFYRPMENDKKEKKLIEDPIFEIKAVNKSVTRDTIIGTVWVRWSELQKMKGGAAQWFNFVRGDEKKPAGQISLSSTDCKFA
jgi:Ca2+-dependent lipid-binding protein